MLEEIKVNNRTYSTAELQKLNSVDFHNLEATMEIDEDKLMEQLRNSKSPKDTRELSKKLSHVQQARQAMFEIGVNKNRDEIFQLLDNNLSTSNTPSSNSYNETLTTVNNTYISVEDEINNQIRTIHKDKHEIIEEFDSTEENTPKTDIEQAEAPRTDYNLPNYYNQLLESLNVKNVELTAMESESASLIEEHKANIAEIGKKYRFSLLPVKVEEKSIFAKLKDFLVSKFSKAKAKEQLAATQAIIGDIKSKLTNPEKQNDEQSDKTGTLTFTKLLALSNITIGDSTDLNLTAKLDINKFKEKISEFVKSTISKDEVHLMGVYHGIEIYDINEKTLPKMKNINGHNSIALNFDLLKKNEFSSKEISALVSHEIKYYELKNQYMNNPNILNELLERQETETAYEYFPQKLRNKDELIEKYARFDADRYVIGDPKIGKEILFSALEKSTEFLATLRNDNSETIGNIFQRQQQISQNKLGTLTEKQNDEPDLEL